MSVTNFEAQAETIDWSRGNRGIADCEPIPALATWSFGNPGTALGRSSAANAYIISAGGSNQLEAVNWKATAATTDLVQFTMALPWRMRRYSGKSKSGLLLALRVRRVQVSGSTDDTALGLNALAIFQSPTINDQGVETDGTGFVTSTADIFTPSASAADNAPGKFRVYRFDLFKGLTDAQKALIVPGSTITVRLSPSKTVAADLALQVAGGGRLLLQKHPAPMRWLSKLLRA